jgi:hypothetical protein
VVAAVAVAVAELMHVSKTWWGFVALMCFLERVERTIAGRGPPTHPLKCI